MRTKHTSAGQAEVFERGGMMQVYEQFNIEGRTALVTGSVSSAALWRVLLLRRVAGWLFWAVLPLK